MHFAFFHSFAPPKSSKMDISWIIMEFFENEITKWTNLIDKMTSLPGYRLLTSTSNKLKLFCSHSETPCINGATTNHDFLGSFFVKKNLG